MIIPWLRGFINWERTPVTWALVFSNVFFFLFTLEPSYNPAVEYFSSAEDLVLTGKIYYAFRQFRKEKIETSQRVHEKKMDPQSQEVYLKWGIQALRDSLFVNLERDEIRKIGLKVGVDETQNGVGENSAEVFDSWLKKLENYRSELRERPSYLFGLKAQSKDWQNWTWITYQFMHANSVHLVTNMVLLLVIGGALEVLLSGVFVALIYILSGLLGGLLFFLLGNETLIPMVGASASLSGLVSFYALYETRRYVSFFYFFSPWEGYYGWIYLPVFFLLPLYLLTDLSVWLVSLPPLFQVGALASKSLIGGDPQFWGWGGGGSAVAHVAHVGGGLLGLILGLGLRLGQWLKGLLRGIQIPGWGESSREKDHQKG